jgi:hypothetical protein
MLAWDGTWKEKGNSNTETEDWDYETCFPYPTSAAPANHRNFPKERIHESGITTTAFVRSVCRRGTLSVLSEKINNKMQYLSELCLCVK